MLCCIYLWSGSTAMWAQRDSVACSVHLMLWIIGNISLFFYYHKSHEFSTIRQLDNVQEIRNNLALLCVHYLPVLFNDNQMHGLITATHTCACVCVCFEGTRSTKGILFTCLHASVFMGLGKKEWYNDQGQRVGRCTAVHLLCMFSEQ